GLHVHLPGTAENIEVIDVETAQRRLQGVENIADLDAQDLSLVAVNVQIDLRRVGTVSGENTGKLGLGIGRHRQPAQDRSQVSRRLSLQRLEHELEAAGVAQSKYGRQVERKRNRAFDRRELRAQAGDNRRRTLRWISAIFVRL